MTKRRYRPDFEYNNRRGATVYPIKAGAVLYVKKTCSRKNPHTGVIINYHEILWILRVCKRRKKSSRAQDNSVRLVRLLVPTANGMGHNHIMEERSEKLRSLAKQLRAGYEIIDDKCAWRYIDRDADRFYSKVQKYLKVSLL